MSEQRREPEHGPVAPRHMPQAASEHDRDEQHAADARARAGDVRAERERTTFDEGERERDGDRDLERGRPLAGRERREGARAALRSSARRSRAHAVGARRRRGAAAASRGARRRRGVAARRRRRAPGRSPRLAATPRHVGAPAPAASAARSSRATASGSSASAIARTTTAAARPRATTAPTVAGVDPADREPRDARTCAAAWRTVEPDRRPALLRRRRVDRPDGDVVGAARRAASACASECVDSPTIASSPTTARASATGVSSWPTWTPSAPPARARSGRSLTMNSAPWVAQRSAAHAAAARISASVARLVAKLDEVDAAAQRAVERALEARAVRDEVQARVPQARAAVAVRHPQSQPRRRRYHGAGTGAPTRAERAAPRPPTVRS